MRLRILVRWIDRLRRDRFAFAIRSAFDSFREVARAEWEGAEYSLETGVVDFFEDLPEER